MPKIVDGVELFRIGEVARRAGVNRGTVQHYIREGLLPKPVKTHRNMAWYDASFVERIKQIKEMQARFLPLSVIKRLLGSTGKPGGLARTLVRSQEAALATLERTHTPVAREDAPTALGIPARSIDELLEAGLVSTEVVDGREVFPGPDVEVLATLASFQREEFTRKLGFSVADLLIYKDALQELLQREVATYLRAVSGRGAAEPKLARAAIEGATMLILALRRKLIRDFLVAANPTIVDAYLATRRGKPAPASSASPASRPRRRRRR